MPVSQALEIHGVSTKSYAILPESTKQSSKPITNKDKHKLSPKKKKKTKEGKKSFRALKRSEANIHTNKLP